MELDPLGRTQLHLDSAISALEQSTSPDSVEREKLLHVALLGMWSVVELSGTALLHDDAVLLLQKVRYLSDLMEKIGAFERIN